MPNQITPNSQTKFLNEFFKNNTASSQFDKVSTVISNKEEDGMNIIRYFHAKAYINSSPIKFLVLQKKIEDFLDKEQQDIVHNFINELSSDYIDEHTFIKLFEMVNDPNKSYSVVNSHLKALLFPW